MRILYHHRTLGDGAEGIHVASMVTGFERLGHEVRVAAIIGSQTNVATTRTRLLEPLTRRTPRLVYELLELGYTAFGYRAVTTQMASWQPDFLYERYTLHNLAGVAVSRRAGIPLVLEVNAPLALERAVYEHLAWKALARRSERFVCSHATLVLAVSTPLKEYLTAMGVPEQPIVVLPNGADPDVFRPNPEARRATRARLGIPPGRVVAGFAGILRSWHGVDLLLQATALTAERDRPHVLIVGDGPVRPQLQQQAQALNLQGSVTFTGRVSHAEIPDYLAAFDIGVSPRATFYASPMKVPEYMATGLAVVAPRTPNLADLINDGRDGVLFHPEEAADLASVLTALVQHPERRSELATAARESIVGGRTWQHNAARVVDLVRPYLR